MNTESGLGATQILIVYIVYALEQHRASRRLNFNVELSTLD